MLGLATIANRYYIWNWLVMLHVMQFGMWLHFKVHNLGICLTFLITIKLPEQL